MSEMDLSGRLKYIVGEGLLAYIDGDNLPFLYDLDRKVKIDLVSKFKDQTGAELSSTRYIHWEHQGNVLGLRGHERGADAFYIVEHDSFVVSPPADYAYMLDPWKNDFVVIHHPTERGPRSRHKYGDYMNISFVVDSELEDHFGLEYNYVDGAHSNHNKILVSRYGPSAASIIDADTKTIKERKDLDLLGWVPDGSLVGFKDGAHIVGVDASFNEIDSPVASWLNQFDSGDERYAIFESYLLAPDMRHALAGPHDGRYWLYDVKDGRQLRAFAPGRCEYPLIAKQICSWSPDSMRFAHIDIVPRGNQWDDTGMVSVYSLHNNERWPLPVRAKNIAWRPKP